MNLAVVQHADGTYGLQVDGEDYAEPDGIWSRATPAEVIADARGLYGDLPVTPLVEPELAADPAPFVGTAPEPPAETPPTTE